MVAGVVLDDRAGHSPDYFQTLFYVPAFVGGIVLARHRAAVLRRFGGLAGPARGLLLAAGVALYTYPSWVGGTWFRGANSDIAQLAAITAGGCVLLVCALGSVRAGAFLRRRIPSSWDASPTASTSCIPSSCSPCSTWPARGRRWRRSSP